MQFWAGFIAGALLAWLYLELTHKCGVRLDVPVGNIRDRGEEDVRRFCND